MHFPETEHFQIETQNSFLLDSLSPQSLPCRLQLTDIWILRLKYGVGLPPIDAYGY